MVTLLALAAAVVGYWALRRERDGARAAADAGSLALVLACGLAGAWIVRARGGGDGTSGVLAGVVVGSVLAQLARDRLIGR